MAKLVVLSEEMKDRTFELTEKKITVGRLPDNNIRLENTAVSSHHAELIQKGEDYVVHDLNSTNGTRVNGQRIIETRLSHGDTIWFGHLELQYLSSAKNAPQPLPALKKSVDLSSTASGKGITAKPTTFNRTSSPYSKRDRGRSKKILQVLVLCLGLVAIVALAVVIVLILGKTSN
jgi:pSer/pThr/pTyr-binding forkhead associated (FHA) protein